MAELTRAEIYAEAERAKRLAKEENKVPDDLVEVVCKSGNTYSIRKPDFNYILFVMPNLPQEQAAIAAKKWADNGLLELGEDAAPNQAEMMKTGASVLEIRDYVLELSYDPKLVIGAAKAPNELSTKDCPKEDLAELFKWVSSGGLIGGDSERLSNFSNGRGQSATIGVNGKGTKRKGKRTRRVKK